ncbi:MAG: glycosyltransferase family 39 protein [Myxococcales bacterium]|nr:glycosyltransferase family 39 protein [Myxococcales bacterium]
MRSTRQIRHHALSLTDYLAALVISVISLVILVNTMDMGFTRAEGFYFRAAEQYQRWFDELGDNWDAGQIEESFTQENIDRHWSENPEHPVLMKTLFGLSWHAFSQVDNDERDSPDAAIEEALLSPSTAMRLPTAVFSAVLIGLLFLFVVEAFGTRLGAVFACVSLLFMPRYFFHSHLACFDAPMSAMWFVVVYAYWKSLHSRLWVWLAGIAFGVALITKLNAFFIPFVLLAHWFFGGLRDFSVSEAHAAKGEIGVKRSGPIDMARRVMGRIAGFRVRIPAIPSAFVSMLLLGPLIFYLGWPRHWFDTYNRIVWYFARHLEHEHYYVNYFGEALIRPPFPVAFPFVMTLITVPAITLAASAYGSGLTLRQWFRQLRQSDAERDNRATGVLITLNILIPILIIARPSTPVFGGTKHWMQAMPFMCAMAGVGVSSAFEGLWERTEGSRAKLLRMGGAALFVGLLSIPTVHATLSVHPHGTAYYNELIGGVRGAADSDQMRQYWGYACRDVLSFLNENAPPNSTIYPHNALGEAMRYYREDGLLREDIRDSWNPSSADYLFFFHQRAFLSSTGAPPSLFDIWRAAQTDAPVAVATVEGVPVCSLYQRRH